MCTTASPTEMALIVGIGGAIVLPPVIAAAVALWRPTRAARIAALALALPGALLGAWSLRGGATFLSTLGTFLIVASALWVASLARAERGWRIAAAATTAPPLLIVAYYAAQALLVTPTC